MTNYSNNCVRYLLLIFATFFVYGNAGATPITFGSGNSTYEQNSDGSYTVTLKAAGDLKAMENTWNYGFNTPWKSASKLILYLDESIGSSAIQEIKNTDELYLLTQNTTVSTLDLSNFTSDQADNLKPGVNWPGQWSTQSNSLRNIIVPAKYAATPNSYSTDQINFIGKTGSTIYLYRQYNNYDIEWSLIRNDETTLKIVGEYSNGFNISNATYFENIDLTTLSFSSENAKITLPTVGADGVALTKIIVISNDAKSMIANTDAATLAAIKVASSGSGDSGEGGEGGDDPIDPSSMTLQQKIAARMQLSDAPTVYIDLPDIGNATLGEYLYKIRGKGTKEDDAPYRRASIKVVATSDTSSPHYMESFEEDADHLEIKVRGNSTALEGGNNTQGKRAYRLKFAKKDKETGKNFKHDMINGGYSKRNWSLLANVMDHSMLRNAVTCELGKIVGLPFNPGYKFVDLVINGDYRGTYQITDHPEVDGDRINVNEDTGWYVEFQGQQDMCDYPMFVTSPYFINIKNPEPTADATTEAELYNSQMQTIKDEVSAWFGQSGWQKGFGANFTNPTLGWRAYNDEETLMNWWIVTEITGDYDGMMTVKAYREADGKLHWGPVWDKDLAYGNYNGSNMGTATGSLVMNCSNSTNYMKTMFAKFSTDPEFMLKVKTKMDALVAAGLKATLCDKIDELANNIAGTEALNYNKWGYTSPQAGVEEQYHAGVTGYDKYTAYVTQLKNWINDRVDYVQQQFTSLSNTANAVQDGTVTYDVTKTSNENANLTDGIYKETNLDKYINVTLTGRTFAANEWSAISLPFSVDETKMKTIFGNSYDIKTFTGVSDDGTKMIFETPADKSIKAGMPYIIKPSQAVSDNTTFNKVIFSCYANWDSNVNANGESITFGNYTLTSSLYNAYLSNKNLIGSDGITLSATNGSSAYNGSIVYITVADGAVAPTIQFGKDVRTQKSYVPTIYIDTEGSAEIQPSTGEYVAAAIEVLDENNLIGGNFTETSAYMEIRGRNKTEWTDANITKKSYRLKFAKDEKDNAGNITTTHKHDLTGGGYAKRNWILVANAADESMVRNALADELGKAMEFEFTPNYQFVDLYINNEYKGTYMATDHVEADKEGDVTRRVPVDEKQGWLLDMVTADGIATGDIYVEGCDSYPYINIKNPEPGKKTGTEEEIKARVKTFFDALWAADNATGLDKASFVNWYIATEILGNASALTAIYAYKENDAEELKFGPLWGNELAFGASTAINMSDLNTPNSYTGMVYQSATASAWKTKLQALWQKNWFKQAVKERWAEIYNSGTDDIKSTMLTKFDEVETAINKADQKPTETQLGVISNYLDNRFEYLNTKFAELTALSGPSITIGAGGYSSFSWPAALDFSATSVEVYVATSYENGILQLEKVADGKVPAKTGIILKGSTGDSIYPESAENVSLTTTNILLNTASEDFTVPAENSYYALATLNDKTALYKIRSGVTIPLYKAYLSVTSQQQAPAAIFFGDIDGTTTGLGMVSTLADGQDGDVYDLQGRRMKGNLAKGIYIKNGKKFIVK